MAHRTNVIQVPEKIEGEDLPDQVEDPVCGMKISRKHSRYVLVRGKDAYYFCSKECRQKFSSSVPYDFRKTGT